MSNIADGHWMHRPNDAVARGREVDEAPHACRHAARGGQPGRGMPVDRVCELADDYALALRGGA